MSFHTTLEKLSKIEWLQDLQTKDHFAKNAKILKNDKLKLSKKEVEQKNIQKTLSKRLKSSKRLRKKEQSDP